MRELTVQEIGWVAGGTGVCTPENSGGADDGNDHLGGAAPSQVGPVLIAIYEGLVEATSHVIERVANSFD